MLRRPVESAQYTSIAFTERLAEAGIDPSVGSVGDAYDNALAESVIGLFKTELIKPCGPWRTVEQVEIATLEYVDWFNHRRLFQACGDITGNVIAAADLSSQALGRIEYLTFAAPDRLIGSGEKSMVVWSVQGATITPRTSVARSWVRELRAVPAWGVVAGMVDSSPVFFDDTTLEPVQPPPADRGIVQQLRGHPGRTVRRRTPSPRAGARRGRGRGHLTPTSSPSAQCGAVAS